MIIVYNTHEPIVSQELWDKCREMEASVSQGKKTNTGYVHPLSGLVYCADCGNKMYMKYNNTRHSRKGPVFTIERTIPAELTRNSVHGRVPAIIFRLKF